MDFSFVTVLKLFYFICSSFLIVTSEDNYGLCADPTCSAPIGKGTTLQVYTAVESGKLSFVPNQKLDIFVKDYGPKKDLMGVVLNGLKGFVPKTFVREDSAFVKDYVPAIVKFGHTQVDSNHVTSHVASHQDTHVIPNTINIQPHSQDHQFIPVTHDTSQFHPPQQFQASSGGAYFDSQTGNFIQEQQPSSNTFQSPQQFSGSEFNNLNQFTGSEATQSPQQHYTSNVHSSYSGSEFNTFQQHSGSEFNNQQFTGSEATAYPQQHSGSEFNNQQFTGSEVTQYPQPHSESSIYSSYAGSELNKFHQHSGSEFNNVQQHSGSGVVNNFQQHSGFETANIAKQHGGSPLPSQNILTSDTQMLSSHNLNTDQVVTSQISGPQHQYDQSGTGYSQDQFQSNSLRASFSQFPGYLPKPSDSQNSFGSEIQHPTFAQVDTTALPNQAPEIVHTPDSYISQQHLGNDATKSEFYPTTGYHESQNKKSQDTVQDTMEMLKNNGYDVHEYIHDYSSETSNGNLYSKPSSDLYEQNRMHPNVQPVVDTSHGVHQMSSQSEALSGLSHTVSLKPSFQSSSTEVKMDDSSTTTASVVASDIETQNTVSEEKLEDDEEDYDGDEAEVEDESDSDIEDIVGDDKQNSDTTLFEKDLKAKEDLKPKEEDSQSDNSVLPSEVQSSNTQESNAQITAYNDIDNTVTAEIFSQNQLKREKSLPEVVDFVEKTREGSKIVDNFEVNSQPPAVEPSRQPPAVGLDRQPPAEVDIKETLPSQTINELTVSNESLHAVNDSLFQGDIPIPLDTKEDGYSKSGIFSFESSDKIVRPESVNETDFFLNKEQAALDNVVNISELSETEKVGYLNPYQIRNLKEDQESKDSENIDSSEEVGENVTYPEYDLYASIENSLEAIRSFIEALLPWIPEPLYTVIIDLENKGISPRVPVFTALSALPCIIVIIAFLYLKEKSKEKKLTTQLAIIEKKVFTLSAEKIILEEKLEKIAAEFESSQAMLNEERKTFDVMKTEVGSLKERIVNANLELENNIEEINTLKEREKEFMELVKDHEKAHLDLMEEKSLIDKKVVDQEDYISRLADQVQEKENEIAVLQEEKSQCKQSNEDYEEKLTQLQKNCNQLLKEAEVWNIRVNELNSKLSEESSVKQELESSLKLKDSEIESLTNLVQNFKSFEELDRTDEDEHKSNEEKLKCLMDSSSILIKLKKQEEENTLLSEKLLGEKTRILDMEVELLESKSEIDKLKVNYNQALQDKTEAQTRLEVLTDYFKNKEILLQKQLGVQEAFREKREKDADSAERQILLIEQENSSYKYQVASMKQEMEETERNLKTQIATQEKKAHENWIAARAAERKLEDMKHEVTQLRQRLTLLEREQENWVNSSRDDVIRPIPKRISGMNDDPASSQDINNSIDSRHMFPPPPPMMLPPDRPLPPLPPIPPFLPPMEPPFRPQPWHLSDPMSSQDFRMTPPDYMRGRELTPPRGRHSAIIDGDMGPLQSSPLGGEMRESRNSTPPHSLPDFHDIPPPPRPFFPPPGHHPRYPLPPPFRKEFAQGQKRTDNGENGSTGRGTQSSSSQDNWPHNNSRV